MLTIRLCYENDRFTPEPRYDQNGQPRLWWLEVDGESTNATVNEWVHKKRSPLMTYTEIEDEVVALGEELGVKDTCSAEQWRAYGIVVKAPSVVGFVNWPDPSFSG